MNMELAAMLNDAIDNYNEEVNEWQYLYWWDVINELHDMTDDEEVLRTIMAIDNETSKLIGKRVAGL